MDMECTPESGCHREMSSIISEIEVMRMREFRYRTTDYLRQRSSAEDAADVTCRAQMIDWMIKIVDHCKFHRNTVEIATRLLDRFLMVSDWAVTDRSSFQLAAITCLYTAIKTHEPTVISVDSMARLSRNAYPADQIEAMERKLLQASQWLVNPSTSLDFTQYFAELVSQMDPRYNAETVTDLAKVQLETTFADYDFSLLPASSISFAAMMNALECMGVSTPQELQQLEGSLMAVSNVDVTSLKALRERLYEGLLAATQSPEAGHYPAVTKSQSSLVLHHSPRSVSQVKLM